MKTMRVLLGVSLLMVSAASFAAAPMLEMSKSVTIDAPVTVVWARAGQFDGLDQWHPAVAKDVLIHGRNNVPGAVRHLTLKGGGDVEEKLLGYSAAKHTYRYTILKSVLPVSDYHSTLRARAVGAHRTVVTWSGTFKRKDTGANPPANANDKTAVGTIASVYQSGLDHLKQIVEAK